MLENTFGNELNKLAFILLWPILEIFSAQSHRSSLGGPPQNSSETWDVNILLCPVFLQQNHKTSRRKHRHVYSFTLLLIIFWGDMSPQAKKTKARINKWDYIKQKCFSTAKEIIRNTDCVISLRIKDSERRNIRRPNIITQLLTITEPFKVVHWRRDHFSILVLRTPWTVWDGQKIEHWKMNSAGW